MRNEILKMLKDTCQKPLQLSNYISNNILIKQQQKNQNYFLFHPLFVCLEMSKIFLGTVYLTNLVLMYHS